MASRRLFRRSNGNYAYAASEPWFGMEANTPELMTAKEALAATGMDEMVFSEHTLKASVDIRVGHGGQLSMPFDVEMPNHKAVLLEEVSTGTLHPAGVVGTGRAVFQFDELLVPLQEVLSATSGQIEVAGLFAGGSEWFAFVQLPKSVTIGGDKHDMYLFGRDGLRSSFSVTSHARRMSCLNMFPTAIAEANRQAFRYVLQHRHGAEVDMAALKSSIDIAYAQAADMDDMSKVMLSQEVADAEFWAMVDGLIGPKPDADASVRTVNHYERRNAELKRILASPTVETTYRDGHMTKWTAFQTLTEWADHKAPVRAQDHRARRMERLAEGTMDGFKASVLVALS